MNLRRRGRLARAVTYNYALNCFYCEDLNDEEGGGEEGAIISDEVARPRFHFVVSDATRFPSTRCAPNDSFQAFSSNRANDFSRLVDQAKKRRAKPEEPPSERETGWGKKKKERKTRRLIKISLNRGRNRFRGA